ncbi:MAG: hypothetical protein LIO59_00305 [Oscillospiraceae bacterium]|nr:hypothetical protein [Clostridiales bacterium]MCC8168830.1 hypothetical protein [Oscillospiraceae bacterium]
MDLERFYVENNTIQLWDVKITERNHALSYLDEDSDEDNYQDVYKYYKAEDVDGYLEQYVAKHKLLEVVATEEYDNSEYEWMAGIELRTDDPNTEIRKIYSYGSVEAYEASLEEAADTYMTDLDYRLSILELGLND